jgi:hypothetical protein
MLTHRKTGESMMPVKNESMMVKKMVMTMRLARKCEIIKRL